MKIIVLVKQVPDTWGDRKLSLATGALDRSPGDCVIDEVGERALEVALLHKDGTDAEVIVLTMGPASAVEVLRKGLAMGADSGIHILDDALARSDVMWTSAVLCAAIATTGYDLVVAGNESTDGRGGVIPAMIAERLGRPHLTFLNTVQISDSTVGGERSTEYGTLSVEASLPAVISVTERSAEPRFPSFKGLLKAKKKPIATLTLADLGIDPAVEFATVGRSTVLSTTPRPARAQGTKIVDSGNAGFELAEFLAAGRLL